MIMIFPPMPSVQYLYPRQQVGQPPKIIGLPRRHYFSVEGLALDLKDEAIPFIFCG